MSVEDGGNLVLFSFYVVRRRLGARGCNVEDGNENRDLKTPLGLMMKVRKRL